MMPSHSRSDRGPSIELDWEQGLFLLLRGAWRRLRPEPGAPAHSCALAPLRDRLTSLARVASGLPVRVVGVRGAGGVRGLDILCPEQVCAAESLSMNASIMCVHVLMSAAMIRGLMQAPMDRSQLDELDVQLRLVERARLALCEDWPRFEAQYLAAARAIELEALPDEPWRDQLIALLQGQPLSGELITMRKVWPSVPLWGRVFEVPAVPSPEASRWREGHDEASPETEHEAPAAPEQLRVLALHDAELKELPAHAFEKVETADDYSGQQQRPDGSDELEEHLEALNELNLDTMYRGGESAASIYRADISLQIAIPDVYSAQPHEAAVRYDEWDFKRGRYKRGWACVYPTALPQATSPWATQVALERRVQIASLVRLLSHHRQQLRPRPRQQLGEELDLDAIIDELASRAAGGGGESRLYTRTHRQQRHVALTVLMDMSLSSDAWIQERRVMDVAREAVVVLAEVCAKLGDELQVLGFASNTRNMVRVFTIKGWDESWGAARGRLGELRPQGYTRIGPALRHATSELLKRQALKRALILLSDGKPTDYDRYEGRYGLADVRQAVREATQAGVLVHSMAIDARARDYLAPMLGEGRWSLMPKVDDLGAALVRHYGRLG